MMKPRKSEGLPDPFDNRRECLKEFTGRNSGLEESGSLLPRSRHVRLGPGPVLAYEWLMATRRWQLYALRVVFVGAILIGMMAVWHNSSQFANPGQTVSIQTLRDMAKACTKRSYRSS